MAFSTHESSSLEFKRELPNKKLTLVKTVIAFSNTYGGQIMIGVGDNSEVIGVAEQLVESICDDLIRAIYDSVTPSIFPSVYTRRIKGKLIIIVDISEGPNKPYHLHSKDVNSGTYVRLGAHTMLASSDMIYQLQWQGNRKFLDEIPVYEATENDIDMHIFEKFLQERVQKTINMDVSDMLFHYRILTKDKGRVLPTTGGLLLFGKDPQKFFPESFIICSHFSGTSGRDAIASRDSKGNLIQQYKDSISFVVSRLNTSYKIRGSGKRDEELEIPDEAIREIVINAIVHRNYQIPGPSKIAIYDNRVEIFSPGNFPGPIKLDKVNIGITYVRNSIITRVFRDYGIIEKLGSGFITLFESYAKRRLPTPIINEGTGFIKCILPRKEKHKSSHGLSEIESLFLTQEYITTQDVMSYLDVSKSTAIRALRKLFQQGRLIKVGKGPSTRYQMSK